MKTTPSLSRRALRRGFSLVELLVVMMIILMLMAIAIPALTGTLRSSHLNSAGRSVIDQLNLAGQTARSRNVSVEVRFYLLPDYNKAVTETATVYRGFQLFSINEGGQAIPLGKPEYFHNPVVISTDPKMSALFADKSDSNSAQYEHSPLSAGANADPRLPEFDWNYKYTPFQFTPSGATNLKAGKEYLTLLLKNGDSLEKGGNFYTIQVDPISGSVRSFRP